MAWRPSSQVLMGLLGIRDGSQVSDLTSALVKQTELPLSFLECWTSRAGEPFPFRPAGCNLLWLPWWKSRGSTSVLCLQGCCSLCPSPPTPGAIISEYLRQEDTRNLTCYSYGGLCCWLTCSHVLWLLYLVLLPLDGPSLITSFNFNYLS